MDPALFAIAKMGLHIYLASLKTAGKTDEEIMQIFYQTKAEFDQKDPNDLKDV